LGLCARLTSMSTPTPASFCSRDGHPTLSATEERDGAFGVWDNRRRGAHCVSHDEAFWWASAPRCERADFSCRAFADLFEAFSGVTLHSREERPDGYTRVSILTARGRLYSVATRDARMVSLIGLGAESGTLAHLVQAFGFRREAA